MIIEVQGTIAPYTFSNGTWSTTPLYDASGVFGTPGALLSGDPFLVTWTFDDASLLVSGVLTINNISLTYGSGLHDVLSLTPLYVNTTVTPGLEAMNTYEHAALPFSPFGVGGGFRHDGLNGYFMVTSASLDGSLLFSVPGPLLGTGLAPLLLLALVFLARRKKSA